MSYISFIAGLMMVATCGQAFAQSTAVTPICHPDKISNSSGAMIRMTSGQIFQVYPGASAKTSIWLPLDKVNVCRIGGSASEITNLRTKQQIKALRQ